MAVGKITGQMLGDIYGNLDRDGVDLAFDTDLIYLDVANRRVGINTTLPDADLTVDGTTKTTNLEVSTQANLADITISGSTIVSNTGTLNLNPFDTVVYQSKLQVDSIQLQGNTISTIDSNANLEFKANGTGKINIDSDVLINGNLHATGTITFDAGTGGNINLGDTNTDSIIINADVASNIIPDTTLQYTLGTDSQRWNDIWVKNIYATDVNAGEILVDGIDIALRQGNIYYVALNGNDGNTGTHQNDPLSSIGRALDLAVSGDTIYIYPGTYQETLPLVVPTGVTVKGAGIRSVIVEPDSDVTVDIFLLNGETTIEDLTIKGFEYDSMTNTGYAFKFAPGFKVTTRSPYIRNVTVITAGSTVRLMTNPADDPRGFLAGDAGRGAYIDGSIADPTSREASMLFHSVTFICPGVDVITMTNGVRVEWLNCFTYFANRGLYAVSGSLGFAGDGKTRVKISSRTGTWNVGNTLSYYDTDGTTVLASGTIESIDGDYFVLDTKVLGFETLSDRDPKTVYVNGNAKLSTAIKKFGVSSLALDGTGDYINLTSQPDFNFGTGDFCLEAWLYPTATGTYRTIFDLRSSAGDTGGIILGLSDINALYFYYNGNYRVGPVGTVSTNTWTHVALARVSGTTRAFVDGTQVGSDYTDANNYAARPVRIGADPNGNYAFPGYIDDVRISKGVGRYSSTFTTPTSTFTGDNSTVLLLHFDGPNNSTTIVDDGVTLQDLRTSAGGTASIIDFADYSDFGAEIRSIASASVYGNYGAYGDGDGVIGYLISTNFAYIGSGRFSNNDPTNTTQSNEVVELNRAQLYYTTVDNKGDFRVGDYFFVDQRNGNVQFTASTIEIVSPSGVTFTDGSNVTTVDPTKIETGNIRISGNTIESTTGGITLTAANNTISVTSNINQTGNLTVSNNLTVNGNTVIGDTSSDTITVNAEINSDLVPDANTTYNLGSASNQWKNVYLATAQIDDISIAGNLIQTTVSNSNLELRANGTGAIRIDNFDISNNLITVNTGNTDINITPTGTGKVKLNSNTDVTGNLSITGNIVLGGNIQIGDAASDTINLVGVITNNLIPQSTGTWNIGSNLYRWKTLYASGLQIDDIEINDNYITTTASNANLELRYNGSGAVRIDDFDIKNNIISINSTNNNLTLQANGTGTLELNSNTNVTGNLTTTGNLVVNANTTLGNTSSDLVNFVAKISSNFIPETTSLYNLGSQLLRWNALYSTYALIDDIEINDNYITTTTSNANLELRSSGSGSVRIDNLDFKNNDITANTSNTDINVNATGTGKINLNSNTEITGTLTVSGTSTFNGNIIIGDSTADTVTFNSYVGSDIIPTNNSLYNFGTSLLRWNNIYASKFIVDDIVIDTNVIESTLSNQNLELRANGTGSIQIDQLNFKNNLISSNTTDTDIEINPNGTGKVQLLKDTDITGNLDVTGDITIGGNIQIGDQTTDTINLVGRVNNDIIPSLNSVYNIGSDSLRWNNVYASKAIIDDIVIDTNVIQSTLSNQNLELRANGTGSIRIDSLDFKNNSIIANGTNTDINITPTGTGKVKLNSNTDITGDLSVTGNIVLGGNIQIGDQSSDTINLVGQITNNLIPQSTGTYTIGNSVNSWKNLYTSSVFVDDIEINDNYIRVTSSNADLELRASGTGSVIIDQISFKDNTVSSNVLNGDIIFIPNVGGVSRFLSDVVANNDVTISGNILANGNTNFGNTTSDTFSFTGRINSDFIPSTSTGYTLGTSSYRWKNLYSNNIIVDNITVNDNYITTLSSNADLELRANGTGNISIPSNNFVVDQNFTVSTGTTNLKNTNINGVLTVSSLTLNNQVLANSFTTGDIEIQGNVIRTTVSNSNLELRANGSGAVQVENLSVNGSSITGTVPGQDIELTPSGTGVVKINSTQALTVPVGTTAERPTSPTAGMVRFNTSYNQYEGYNGTQWIQLGGISDVDRNTYITAELTPGANDNVIRFVSNGQLSATLNATEFNTNKLVVDDIEVDGNVIRTTASNSDLELNANGTGGIVFENIKFTQNTITNTTSGAITEFRSTGTGYYSIVGTNAFVIPSGGNSARPGVPVIGMMRFNIDDQLVEIYDGTTWVSVAGATSGISLATAQEIAITTALIFG